VGADYGRGVVGGEDVEGGHLAVVGEKAGGWWWGAFILVRG
jgi:hypothetical protein